MPSTAALTSTSVHSLSHLLFPLHTRFFPFYKTPDHSSTLLAPSPPFPVLSQEGSSDLSARVGAQVVVGLKAEPA